jgi:hypothetical protein
MCHGDVGMVTYSWANFSRKPQAKATGHQCVEWDSIVEWTKERAVNMFAPEFLVHPILGEYDTLPVLGLRSIADIISPNTKDQYIGRTRQKDLWTKT